jgi:predicted RNA-binding protein with EMAP domain
MKFKIRDKSGREFMVEEIEDADKSMGTYNGYSIKQNVDGNIYVLKKSGEKQFFESWKKAYEAIKSGAIKDESLTNSYSDDDELSPEEIASLKQLAAVADKLVSLVNTTTDEDEEEEQIEDEEEERIEEVIDTSKIKSADSIKKSAIAIEKKIKADDSLDKDTVSDAWAKRYGGNK